MGTSTLSIKKNGYLVVKSCHFLAKYFVPVWFQLVRVVDRREFRNFESLVSDLGIINGYCFGMGELDENWIEILINIAAKSAKKWQSNPVIMFCLCCLVACPLKNFL